MNNRLKFLVHISALLLFCSTAVAQKTMVVLQAGVSDSSFYALAKINSNEFWAGGKHGILKKIDSLGNVSSLNFPNAGSNILKITSTEKYVFIATDNGEIYRYDIHTKEFLKKEFLKFKNSCFYDLIVLKNGQLMICGGAGGISKGEKKIPHGFIATLNQDLEELKIVWKSSRKFIWSLLELENNQVLAASFNGISTKIIQTENFERWQRKSKVKGLVHEIALLDNEVWYCGTKNIKYKKDGIVGQMTKSKKQTQYNKTGCLWTMNTMEGKLILVTQSGELLKIDMETQQAEQIKMPKAFTLYAIEKVSKTKLLAVGQGRGAYIVDFKEHTPVN